MVFRFPGLETMRRKEREKMWGLAIGREFKRDLEKTPVAQRGRSILKMQIYGGFGWEVARLEEKMKRE